MRFIHIFVYLCIAYAFTNRQGADLSRPVPDKETAEAVSGAGVVYNYLRYAGKGPGTADPHTYENYQNRPGRQSSRSYINADGQRVAGPAAAKNPPSGATAQCRDGTYSRSKNRRGTCSHHGGVRKWLK